MKYTEKSSVEVVFSYTESEHSVGVKPSAVRDRGVQEKEAVSNGGAALKTELRGNNTACAGLGIDAARVHNGKLSALENNSLNAVREKSAVIPHAVENNIAHAYHTLNGLIAGFSENDPAEPVKILRVVVFASAYNGCSVFTTGLCALIRSTNR